MSNTTNSTPTVDQLQRRITRLERQLALAIEQRDEARLAVVSKAQALTVHRLGFEMYRGERLPSDVVQAVRQGHMTLAQAVAERDAQWQVFGYGAALELADAYQFAV